MEPGSSRKDVQPSTSSEAEVVIIKGSLKRGAFVISSSSFDAACTFKVLPTYLHSTCMYFQISSDVTETVHVTAHVLVHKHYFHHVHSL